MTDYETMKRIRRMERKLFWAYVCDRIIKHFKRKAR